MPDKIYQLVQEVAAGNATALVLANDMINQADGMKLLNFCKKNHFTGAELLEAAKPPVSEPEVSSIQVVRLLMHRFSNEEYKKKQMRRLGQMHSKRRSL